MAFRPQESEVNDLNNSCENSEQKPSIPLSIYANKLDEKVKKRYVEKISAIGIDPVLIEGKNFEPDCLPTVESTDLLFYLVLYETMDGPLYTSEVRNSPPEVRSEIPTVKVTPNLRGATLVDFFFCQENESSSVKVSFPEKSKQKY